MALEINLDAITEVLYDYSQVAIKGLKNAASAIAHGAINVTAEATDLVYKSTLLIGVFTSTVLAADSYLVVKDLSPIMSRCGEYLPLLLQAGPKGYDCTLAKLLPAEVVSEATKQALFAMGVLSVATPIVALTFRKINILTNKLNDSF